MKVPEHAGTVRVLGHDLEYRWSGPPPQEAPTIVFLHEGLGSAAMWKGFPARLAERTGCGALVYSRLGHGRSDPLTAPRTPRFMHDEALTTLPAVLRELRVAEPVLFGHSDGASIALLYAGSDPPPSIAPLALALEAPHVFVEPLSIESIARMRVEYETTDLPSKLAKHHGGNTETMFRGWNDIWLSPEFQSWNIESCLPRIRQPLLVIQGEQDEYGTWNQVDSILRHVTGPARALRLADCGHAPHRDQPEAVLETATAFLRETLAARVVLPSPT
jgi:pimeloyl-ACP methyl ester carboxylesterase